MPRTFSLNLRNELFAQEMSAVPVVLVEITDSSGNVFRLSSDPTQKLSDSPRIYGTIHNFREYEFVLMSLLLPDDQEGPPTTTSIVFENVVAEMGYLAQQIMEPLDVTLKIVLSTDADTIEEEYAGLKTVRSSYDSERLTLDISRSPVTSEPWPSQRVTKTRFPGLYR